MGSGFVLRRSLLQVSLVSIFLLSLVIVGDAAVDFRRMYCDQRHRFAPSEDQSFVEMLDNLLELSRNGFSGVDVTATDREARFEGRAGCLWHNCQIYDGECYKCRSTRDAQACIETSIAEIKHSLKQNDRYASGYCPRTIKFASGERSVAVDDPSTTFQVCGVQYRYLGNLALVKRSAF